jgi:hypothetical protein
VKEDGGWEKVTQPSFAGNRKNELKPLRNYLRPDTGQQGDVCQLSKNR